MPPIPALIPLSLLEAVQNIDTPADDGLGALQDELVAKRLGLSPTVAAQIRRYREQVAQGGDVGDEEGLAVFRLVGRRNDAGLVFADAGRRAARYAARRLSGPARGMIAAAPGRAGRALGLRSAGNLARRWLLIDLKPSEAGARAESIRSLAIMARDDGAACPFYTAALAELLRNVARLEWAVEHVSCRGRGDPLCVWRAAPSGRYE
jgi:predicted hydrocarbon binding protein